MRKILICLTLVLFLNSCGGNKEQVVKPPSTNEEAIQTYQEALKGLKEGNFLFPIQYNS